MLANLVKKNFYRDSVFLMALSNKVKSIDGVIDSSVMMATDANKKLLTETGFITYEGASALPNDLLICLSYNAQADIKKIMAGVENMLDVTVSRENARSRVYENPKNIEEAVELQPDSNIAVISIPGQYVRYQSEKLLKKGVNQMIFSDNISLEDEIHLKKIGVEKNLLVLGPDCGTAIINGVPLGFANVVRSGSIGVVAASGTGTQEVATIIHKNGEGITQAIGLGGRDLKKDVGGLMAIESIKMLENDPATKVICIVSKPPASEVEEKVLGTIKNCKKPFVIIFLGSKTKRNDSGNLFFAATLEDAALKSIAVLKNKKYAPKKKLPKKFFGLASKERKKHSKNQKYVRGLFSGGTLCDEAMFVLEDSLGGVYSNIAVNPDLKLIDRNISYKNSFIDLGDDEFTRGVPHPMIDFTTRNKRMIQEAKDKEVAVIFFDMVLGYGAHSDPANAILPAIIESQKIAKKQKRHITFITSICGTDLDPQGFNKQKEILENAGVIILPSNVTAAKFVERIING
ncbi:MAG: acyl-CoA synthetase FdrA [Elusimicrobia bacterium]|nr:acyl-CoA synthetase FdrA [Elusimicrobiota bacterium]